MWGSEEVCFPGLDLNLSYANEQKLGRWEGGKTRYRREVGGWQPEAPERWVSTEPKQNWPLESVAHPSTVGERQGRGRYSQSSTFSRSKMRKLPIISFCVLGLEAADQICRDKGQRSDGSEESEKDLRTCGRQVETELKAEAMDSW